MKHVTNELRTRLVAAPERITRPWHVIDAKGQVLGRVSVKIAGLLYGRAKTGWSHMQDTGDHVVVINAAQVRLTGRKETTKTYFHHTRYLGHLKSKSFQQLKQERPTEVIRHAVYGMLPDNRLRKTMLRRLHIYAGAEHPHKKNINVS